ncbi:MAG: PAS domain-containing protein [Methanoculleus sp.]|nr:PAS domain-containing protein [Methanoculleus sp.]
MSQETKELSAPAGQIEVAEVERLVRERTREIQSENEALRRENAELLRAKGMLGTFEAQMGEAMYRALLDSIDEGFCIIEVIFDAGGEPVDYRFLETNRAFAKQTGMHNALGKRMRELVPDHEEHWFEIYGAIAETGEPRSFTQAAKLLMGAWYDVYAFPSGGPGSNRVAILFTDITHRKRAEEALRLSEERFRAFVTASSEVIYCMSPDWREMHYLEGKEFIPDTDAPDSAWPDVYIYPSDQPHVQAAINEAIRTRSTFELEHRVMRVDGTPGWVHSRAVPMLDADGEIVEWFGAASDITERKHVEEIIASERQRFLAMVDSLPIIVCLLTPDRQIVFANQAFRERFGELDGRRCYEYCCGLTEPCSFCESLLPLRTGRPNRREFRSPGGDMILDVYDFPFTDIDGSSLILEAGIDITERKQAEEVLARHAEDLIRLQRDLEAANREANLYLDILTHDMRNTENVSNLYAELLADMLEGKAAQYLEKLRQSIDKSIEILGTVSTIRRIHQASPELKPMDLDATIRGVIGDYPMCTIHYDAGARRRVRADDLLSVIFNNLIGNAVKHGGPGVEVTVRVEEQDGEVLVRIEDTGPGVPDDAKYEIFHQYEMKKRGVGEGLGLYLVQILVERYGGRIWMEDRVPSRGGEGAAFVFTLERM